VAKAPDADVFLLLQLVDNPQGGNVEAIALNSMQRAGFRALEGSRTTINGLQAFIGLYEGQIEGMGVVASRAAHIAHDNRVYMIAGLVSPNLFRQADASLTGAIRSFRALTTAEAAAIRPYRIDLYVVRQGDTWAGLAERSSGGISAASLAIMNGSNPGFAPAVGARIRIVVEG
jgi:predicted Zn-dependent protease